MVAYLDRTTGWWRHSTEDDQALMMAKIDLILDRLKAIEEKLNRFKRAPPPSRDWQHGGK